MVFNPCEQSIYLYVAGLHQTAVIDIWAHCQAVIAVYEKSPKSYRLAEVAVCRQVLANWTALARLWVQTGRVTLNAKSIYFTT